MFRGMTRIRSALKLVKWKYEETEEALMLYYQRAALAVNAAKSWPHPNEFSGVLDTRHA